MNKKEFQNFCKSYQSKTTLEAMEKQPDETYLDSAKRNITWLRDWAEEVAQSLERHFTNGDCGK